MTIRNNPYYSLFLSKNLSALDEKNVRRAELDEYYYGARYYNPRESVWLSVDPLFEKTMTPYQYTYQNPLKYTDPTGMKGEDWVQQGSRIIWDEQVTSKQNTKPGQTYIGKSDEDVLNYLGVNNSQKFERTKYGSISSEENGNVVTEWTRLYLNGQINISLNTNFDKTEVIGVNIQAFVEDLKSSNGNITPVAGGTATLDYAYMKGETKTLIPTVNSIPSGREAVFSIPLSKALEYKDYQKTISMKINLYNERDNMHTPVVIHPILPIPVSLRIDSGKGGGLFFPNKGLPLNRNKNAKKAIKF
jgi:RHS repeat-associated protein